MQSTEYALKAAHARTHLHRRRLHPAFAADRIRARHHARGDPGRRAGGGRIFRGAAAAQSFSRDLCRRRLQRGVRAGLCACPRRARRGDGPPVRRPHLHAAVCLATGPACRRLAVHAAGHEHSRAWLHRRRRAAAAGDRTDADHLSLFAADHAGDALWRHAQRDAPLCQRGRGADLPQSCDDDDAGAGRVLSRARATPPPGAS